jgi:hypothetical protein
MTVASFGALRVVADVPQSVATRVRSVARASVYLDGERIESGKVAVYPSADPGSSTFRARVELPANVRGASPGVYAKVGFTTGEAQRTLVPRSAVVERSELRAVYVVTPDGRVGLRQVRLGHAVGDQVEVIAGLARGERVATDPSAAGVATRAVSSNE